MKSYIKNSLLLLLIGWSLSGTAQPSWTKKATKSVFTLKTFAEDGSLIASSNGFFTGVNGEAVSNFTPFKGASRALVIDAQGKEMQVTGIIGANDMYDVVKFRVDGKTQPLSIATATAAVGSNVWLLPYHEVKTLRKGSIYKAETFLNDYTYYTVAMTIPENAVSCPLLNDAGEVIGMMQQTASYKDTLSYAVSARFADSLKISGFAMNDPTLLLTKIKKELPDDIKDATLAVFLASSQTDSASYAALVNDFINKFPQSVDGYTYRAQLEASGGDFSAADHDMAQALKVASQKDEPHFALARMIYDKNIFQSMLDYDSWSLDKALSEVREAININPISTYRQLEANILYAQKKYSEAYDIYYALSQTDMHNAETFFAAARCKEMLEDTNSMLALMDSTINTFSKPYLKEAAPYFWARAEARRNAGKSRDAISDMNEYEKLMSASINDNFYYIRHQAEIEGRLYQQALNDINRAIQMNPQETLYYAEKASLEIRVGLYDNAITTAQESLAINSEDSDGFLFLGLAQCLKGNKKEGILNLQKAKEMGNTQADALITKYSSQ